MQTPLEIQFTKMHGLGNDFIVINAVTKPIAIEHLDICRLANRHTGIGFDQLLLIEPSAEADFSCRIFNADGSIAEQCGNGMRCVGRFIHEEKLSLKNHFTVATKAGLINITVTDYQHISVNMGKPIMDSPQNISLSGYPNLHLSVLSMGNPHAVLLVDSVERFPVGEIGQQLSTHTLFPQGANIGFMEIVNRNHIRLRTFERGAGETLACGSNSCAAVVVGIKNGLLDHQVTVALALGYLSIEWQGDRHPVIMSGAAEKVFIGTITP